MCRADAQGRRVALADKLDNARSILADYRRLGDALWSRFNAGRQDQLWLLRSLVRAFRAAGETGFLVDEFDRTVSEVERQRVPPNNESGFLPQLMPSRVKCTLVRSHAEWVEGGACLPSAVVKCSSSDDAWVGAVSIL